MPRVPNARDSSHSAMTSAAPMYSRKVALTVKRVSRARPPRPSPTSSAAGRFRPVREPGAGLSALPGWAAGLSGPPGWGVGLSGPLGWQASPGTTGPAGSSTGNSDLEQFGFLVLEQFVHLRHVGMGQLVEFPLRPVALVLTRVAVLDQLVQRVLAVPADVADRHPAVLGLVPGDLDVLPPALLGQLGQDHPDDDAVVRRVDTEVAVADRLLDGGQRGLVERLDDHHPGLGDVEGRQLVDGRLGAVVLGRDLAEHGRVSTPCPDGGELLLGDRDGLLHLFLGFEEAIVYHCRSCWSLPSRLSSLPAGGHWPARDSRPGIAGPGAG